MCRFFKIIFSNRKPIVVVTKNDWAGLIGIVDKLDTAEVIMPISLWEFIKYVVKKEINDG